MNINFFRSSFVTAILLAFFFPSIVFAQQAAVGGGPRDGGGTSSTNSAIDYCVKNASGTSREGVGGAKVATLTAKQLSAIEASAQQKYAEVYSLTLAGGGSVTQASAAANAASKAQRSSQILKACTTAVKASGGSGTGTGTGTGSGTGTGTGGGTDTGGGGSTDGGASGGAGLSNDQINSVADVIPGASFDTVLGTFSNPLEFETLPELIIRLINILLMLAAMVSVLVIIAGGFNLVTANGNETKITKGKRSIMWAIGGLVISLMSFSIVAIVQSIIS